MRAVRATQELERLRRWLAEGGEARWGKLFDELDADRSGELGEEQFRTLLLANEIELDETNFRLLVDTMDPEGDGLITRDSFAEHIAGREDARRPARFRRNGHGTPVRASSRAPKAGPPSPRFSAEV